MQPKTIQKYLIFCILIILISSTLWVYYLMKWTNPDSARIIIQSGARVATIANLLYEKNIISSSTLFKIIIRLKNNTQLQAGEYYFKDGLTLKQVISMLQYGQIYPTDIKITLVDGWTIEQMDNYLFNKSILPKGEFIKEAHQVQKYKSKYTFLENISSNTLEGFLFPDTYQIHNNATANNIINKMLTNFQNRMQKQTTKITSSSEPTLYDIVTIASIIEREVKFNTEKSIVSDILWKRLKINMPLQVDSTLNYITHNQSFRLNEQELKIDNPYNTYKYKGLPPTPISNPGYESLNAALNPQDSPYLYFLSKPNGESVFSKTHAEHVINKHKWLLNN